MAEEDLDRRVKELLEESEEPESRKEIIKGAEKANVWELEGKYTVHLYGPWVGHKIHTGLKSVSFPALTKWEKIDEMMKAVFPGPTTIVVDLEKKTMTFGKVEEKPSDIIEARPICEEEYKEWFENPETSRYEPLVAFERYEPASIVMRFLRGLDIDSCVALISPTYPTLHYVMVKREDMPRAKKALPEESLMKMLIKEVELRGEKVKSSGTSSKSSPLIISEEVASFPSVRELAEVGAY